MRITTSDGKTLNIPNNPLQAYMTGKRHGAQETMDKTAMALLDKAGWHVKSEGPEDRNSIEWLYGQLEYYTEEISTGRIKRRDIKEVLREESKLEFSD